jgi:peroxiredoxin Q/BCP
MSELLSVGSKIPQFETTDQSGKKISTSSLVGRPSVIYFYPKDDTPGCTIEACEFRDGMEDFKKKGVNVYGVSVDDQNSHKKFEEKFNLNFSLLVDNDKRISESFGVLGEKSAKRVTFLVSPEGKIVHVFPKVSPTGHSKEVMDKLTELKLIK